jgi:hypothetical protein
MANKNNRRARRRGNNNGSKGRDQFAGLDKAETWRNVTMAADGTLTGDFKYKLEDVDSIDPLEAHKYVQVSVASTTPLLFTVPLTNRPQSSMNWTSPWYKTTDWVNITFRAKIPVLTRTVDGPDSDGEGETHLVDETRPPRIKVDWRHYGV